MREFLKLNTSFTSGQIDLITPYYDSEVSDSQGKLSFDRLPTFSPKFSDFVIENNNFTDFIYASGTVNGKGIIVSDKVKYILEEYNLVNVRFYKINVLKHIKNKPFYDLPPIDKEYYYLQIVDFDLYNLVEFSRSSFFRYNMFEDRNYDMDIKDYNHFEETKSNLPKGNIVYFKELIMKSTFCELAPDLFYLFFLRYNYIIISKKLKERLIIEKITGLADFTSVNVSCI